MFMKQSVNKSNIWKGRTKIKGGILGGVTWEFSLYDGDTIG